MQFVPREAVLIKVLRLPPVGTDMARQGDREPVVQNRLNLQDLVLVLGEGRRCEHDVGAHRPVDGLHQVQVLAGITTALIDTYTARLHGLALALSELRWASFLKTVCERRVHERALGMPCMSSVQKRHASTFEP